MFKLVLILILCLSFSSQLNQRSANFDTNIKGFIAKIHNFLIPIVTKLESKNEISSNCSLSLKYFLENAVKLKWWALQMLDSSGHFPIGLIDGTFGSMGDFNECVDINSGEDIDPPFIGQYCSPRFQLPFDFYNQYPEDVFYNRTLPVLQLLKTTIMTNAFCIPSTCSPNEFKAILKQILDPLDVETYLDGDDCYHRQEVRQLSPSQRILLYFISTIVVLLILSTLTDYLCSIDEQQLMFGKISFIIESFSLSRNWKTFFSDSPQTQRLDLKIFDFLKVFVMVYVITSHIFLNGLLSFQLIVYKYREVLEMGKDFHSQIMTNSAVFIELVFYMSGTLTVISGLKFFESKRRVPFSIFFISRYVRVIPVQLVSIGMTVLFALLGAGPAFKYYYNQQIINCDQRMWKNLLFVANWDLYPGQCSSQTWFISADLQLFILSYFALQLLATKPKYGIIYSLFWVILGMAIPGALNIWFNIAPPIVRVKNDGLGIEETRVHISHSSTYTHLTEYFMGIITGYIILKINKINLSDFIQNILSIGSVILTISMIFSTYLLNGLEWDSIKLEFFYATFMRFFFTLGLCWMTVSLARGNKGPGKMFNVFSYLSNKKISKICFAATLTNIELIRFIQLSQTTLKDRNMLAMLISVIGFVMISLLVGFLIHITVEMPFNNLFKHILKSKIQTKTKKSE